MTDNFTHATAAPEPGHDAGANPFAAQLARHGVPAEMWPMLSGYGVGTLVEKLGIVFTEISVERVVATMPVEGNQQVAGILHGGASVALAETLGSFGAAVHAGPSRRPVGLDINATHHRPGVSGLVTGVCIPIHRGRSTTTHEIVVSNEAGQRVCTARITNMLLDPS